MNLIKRIDQYNENYVYFSEHIKNNIMNDGYFIRIIYSSQLFILNGIYISLQISNSYVEKYYNKYKCSFDIHFHKDIIDNIRIIEEGILKKVHIKDKTPQYKIYEQLKFGHIKFHSDLVDKVTDMFLLKISGIWETSSEYGITYKFINY